MSLFSKFSYASYFDKSAYIERDNVASKLSSRKLIAHIRPSLSWCTYLYVLFRCMRMNSTDIVLRVVCAYHYSCFTYFNSRRRIGAPGGGGEFVRRVRIAPTDSVVAQDLHGFRRRVRRARDKGVVFSQTQKARAMRLWSARHRKTCARQDRGLLTIGTSSIGGRDELDWGTRRARLGDATSSIGGRDELDWGTRRAFLAVFAYLPPSGQIHDHSDRKPARCVFSGQAGKVASCYARCARSLRRQERIALRSTSIFKGESSLTPCCSHA
jgi:hypothetical protein